MRLARVKSRQRKRTEIKTKCGRFGFRG